MNNQTNLKTLHNTCVYTNQNLYQRRNTFNIMKLIRSHYNSSAYSSFFWLNFIAYELQNFCFVSKSIFKLYYKSKTKSQSTPEPSTTWELGWNTVQANSTISKERKEKRIKKPIGLKYKLNKAKHKTKLKLLKKREKIWRIAN